jgi:hypothetical protein
MKVAKKDLELSEVKQVVKDFFEKESFQVKESSVKKGFQIDASAKGLTSFSVAVVKIYEDDGEITIDYFSGGERRRTSIVQMFGSFMTIFGAGALVLHDLKKKESLETIEEEFWRSIDRFLDSG